MERDFDPSDPQSLRRTNSHQSTVWHRAVRQGNVMVFEWLKKKGPADLINGSNKAGYTPLMVWSLWMGAITMAKRALGG